VISIIFVFIQGEGAVRTRINTDFKRVRRLFGRVFDVRSQRQNGSSLYKKGKALDWSGRINRLSALLRRSGPEVIPLCVWKIEMAASRTRFRYGIYEERRAEQKLVADVLRARVFAEVHYKRAHDGVALLGRFPGQRIDIRHQPVSQFVICDENSLRFGTVGPKFILIGRARSMRPKNGTEP